MTYGRLRRHVEGEATRLAREMCGALLLSYAPTRRTIQYVTAALLVFGAYFADQTLSVWLEQTQQRTKKGLKKRLGKRTSKEGV